MVRLRSFSGARDTRLRLRKENQYGKVIEQEFVVDGEDVWVTFSPQEDVASDASDFSDDFALTLGGYALFNMKDDRTVIGSESVYDVFNMEVGKQVFEESGGVFLQDGWFAVLMLPTRDYRRNLR